MSNSGVTTNRAPSREARSTAAIARAAFERMAPTVGFNWARAIFTKQPNNEGRRGGSRLIRPIRRGKSVHMIALGRTAKGC